MKRWLLGFCAMLFAAASHAAIWTDMWWNPAESGWGLNVAQQRNLLFLTWYVYKHDGSAAWYTALAAQQGPTPAIGYASYSGDVFESTGPHFGAPFDPNAVSRRKVGSATFAPLAPHRANLAYSIDGVAVTKMIERVTLTHIPLSGRYVGGYRTVNQCPVSAPPFGVIDMAVLATVDADGISGNLALDLYFDGQHACTLLGAYRQFGSVYQVNTVAACAYGTFGQFGISDLTKSDEGLEGDLVLGNVGCRFGFVFSATRVQ